MTTQLAVAHAKEINKRLDAKGTVILVFREDGTFEAAEYGRTKSDCSALKEWMNEIVDRIETEWLPAPFSPPSKENGEAG